MVNFFINYAGNGKVDAERNINFGTTILFWT